MEDVKLLPCPFCGEDVAEVGDYNNIHDIDDEDSDEGYTVVCTFSKGGCGASTGWAESAAVAVALWNRRNGEPSNG